MSVKEDSSAAASHPLSQSTKVQLSANKAFHAGKESFVLDFTSNKQLHSFI